MGKDLKGKELGVGICQLKDGRYMARYTNRYGKRMSLYSWNLKEVRTKLTKAKYEDELGRPELIHKNLTLGEIYMLWAKEQEDEVRPNTWAIYRGVYTKHIKQYEFYNINSINEDIVREFIFNLYNNNAKVSTIKQCKMIFSNIMKFSVEKKYCLSNPFTYFKMPKKIKDDGKRQAKKLKENKYMTVQQRECFLRFLDKHKRLYGNLYKLLMFTGMRISEGIALKWENVDLKNRTIYIEEGYIKYYDSETKQLCQNYNAPTKTIASERQIPMSDVVFNILTAQKNLQSKYQSEFVFVDNDNKPLKYINVHMALSNLVKKINSTLQSEGAESDSLLPHVTTHYFRHTFATMCLEKNIHPKIVQQYLGHSSYQITMDTYSHVSDEKSAEEMKKFNQN